MLDENRNAVVKYFCLPCLPRFEHDRGVSSCDIVQMVSNDIPIKDVYNFPERKIFRHILLKLQWITINVVDVIILDFEMSLSQNLRTRKLPIIADCCVFLGVGFKFSVILDFQVNPPGQ